jgi:hypothetical protein
MPLTFRYLALASASLTFCVAAWAQAAPETGRPPAVIPVENEPAPKIVPYPPLPDALARGVVIVQFRTENFRVIPVFGKNAVGVSPRIGHLHVTVDDWPGTWAHTSPDPVIVVGLKPGAHKILLELADPSHKILAKETVVVTVPAQADSKPHGH